MAEIKIEKMVGFKILPIHQYIKEFHPGLTLQAVNYAMRKGKIDYVMVGRERHVALTTTTMCYVPKSAPQRDEKNAPKKAKKFKGGRGYIEL